MSVTPPQLLQNCDITSGYPAERNAIAFRARSRHYSFVVKCIPPPLRALAHHKILESLVIQNGIEAVAFPPSVAKQFAATIPSRISRCQAQIMTDEIIDLKARENLHAFALQRSAQRVIRWWSWLARREFSLQLIMGVSLLIAVPSALFHGYHYVEGLTVTIAQSALDDGNWLTPHIYNARWIERPTLLSWFIAAISLPFGRVIPFIARLPIILSLLTGILLIWRALRPVASAEATVFGATLFLACPIVMRYYVTSVADLPLAVILFGAFLLWWGSYTTGRISLRRWIGIGCLLAIAALLKGPQPIAYFMLGLLAFVALTSTWWQIPGLALAGGVAAVPAGLWYAYVFVPGDQSEWLRYTRLSANGIARPHPLANAVDFFFETFPAALLAVALLLTPTKFCQKNRPPEFYPGTELLWLCLHLSHSVLACRDQSPLYLADGAAPMCAWRHRLRRAIGAVDGPRREQH